jgi:hypothetical protein
MLRNENGISLLEEIIAVALIVMTVTVFLSGLSVGGSGVSTVHKRVSAENLARSGLEHIKDAAYATGENAYEDVIAGVPIPVPGYSLTVGSLVLDTNLQLITVTVLSSDAQVAFVMEEYKRGP